LRPSEDSRPDNEALHLIARRLRSGSHSVWLRSYNPPMLTHPLSGVYAAAITPLEGEDGENATSVIEA